MLGDGIRVCRRVGLGSAAEGGPEASSGQVLGGGVVGEAEGPLAGPVDWLSVGPGVEGPGSASGDGSVAVVGSEPGNADTGASGAGGAERPAAASVSSTEIPNSVARPTSPVSYPCPSARNFQVSARRYSSPQIRAVSSPVSGTTSKTAIGSPSPAAASYSRTCRSVTPAKAPPSDDAASTTRSTAGSSVARSASMVSVSLSASRVLGRCRTKPLGWRGWL